MSIFRSAIDLIGKHYSQEVTAKTNNKEGNSIKDLISRPHGIFHFSKTKDNEGKV